MTFHPSGIQQEKMYVFFPLNIISSFIYKLYHLYVKIAQGQMTK